MGDLPPPCDEFTFNQVDPTHAILYGGIRDPKNLQLLLQGTFILDMSNWVSQLYYQSVYMYTILSNGPTLRAK